jgi:hypothetical protein
MLVQASGDRISTFQAYAAMGLEEGLPQLRGRRARLPPAGPEEDRGFVLLTNNPDKISAMSAAGLKVIRAEPLEFEPVALQPGLPRHQGRRAATS